MIIFILELILRRFHRRINKLGSSLRTIGETHSPLLEDADTYPGFIGPVQRPDSTVFGFCPYGVIRRAIHLKCADRSFFQEVNRLCYLICQLHGNPYLAQL